MPSRVRYLAAACVEIACCRKRPSSARWNVPKDLRNGPCGGSTPEYCYVDKTRPCIWYKIYERSFKMGREEMLLEVLPPLDWEKVGTETWGDVFGQVKKMGTGKVISGLLLKPAKNATRPGTGSSALSASRIGGRAMTNITRPTYTEPVSELERQSQGW